MAMEIPGCYGKYPRYNAQDQAERECFTCPVERKCADNTADTVTLGRKDDSTKPRWSLLPYRTIEQVIKVLEFGAAKYKVDNWMHVEDPQRRYYDAAMRHIDSWRNREKNDPDSGLPHLAHAVCSLLFLMWFDGRDENQ